VFIVQYCHNSANGVGTELAGGGGEPSDFTQANVPDGKAPGDTLGRPRGPPACLERLLAL